jgi:hypothetical protein
MLFYFQKPKTIAIQSDVDPDSSCSSGDLDLDSLKNSNTYLDPKLEVYMSFMEI